MNRVIEVTVAKDGGTTVETQGFHGSDCQAASRFLESALGKRSGERLTSEYFRSNEAERQTERE